MFIISSKKIKNYFNPINVDWHKIQNIIQDTIVYFYEKANFQWNKYHLPGKDGKHKKIPQNFHSTGWIDHEEEFCDKKFKCLSDDLVKKGVLNN
jgi:hypothetical protein